ncbi:hypothetical protein GQ44DRAFT_811700 [Phaeosphaeriaceae sp. PMI808]|nr:hypothetical protein GQ44DRAFT_811700 [Phaeosphaeriaceae sp. PMI808]
MASFRSLTSDRQPLKIFRSQVSNIMSTERAKLGSALHLHLFEWSQSDQIGSESAGLKSIAELESRNEAAIRVIFAPQDVPMPATIDGMCELFDRQRIPSAFIEERLQGVSQSFAVQKDANATYVWFHFLCKDIAISNGQVTHVRGPEDVKHCLEEDRLEAQRQSHANFTWMKPGFLLRIQNPPSSPPPPSRTSTSTSEKTLHSTSVQPEVEMFCFGAPVTIRDRFQSLKEKATCEDLLQDPYIFLEVVLSEMYKIMDKTGWAISDIFGKIETRTLAIASTPGKAAKELEGAHFTGLHNLAKHTIYLRENCESALATLEGLRDHHKTACGDRLTLSQSFTKQSLKYQKTLFQSTQRRLASLDARMANIIQLSFHIVTQGDSRVIQSESQSMKTIAVTTLIFMPLGTVAGIFGTQFMKLEAEAGDHITVSKDFWLLWAIALPLTIIVTVLWRVWYADAKGRLMDEIPRDTKRYMGWKTLPKKIQGSQGLQSLPRSIVTRDNSCTKV